MDETKLKSTSEISMENKKKERNLIHKENNSKYSRSQLASTYSDSD